MTVDGKGCARQGRRAQGAFVEAPPGVGQTSAIAVEHLDIGQQMMAEGDRLGCLKMGEAGHDDVGAGQRLLGQGALETGELAIQAVEGVANVEPEIDGHLIIAGTGGVQPARRFADQIPEPRLDVHVDILKGAGEDEAAFPDIQRKGV